jgi:RNA polymerase sigma factor (TIGR02999 family)
LSHQHDMSDITLMLKAVECGEATASEDLLPLVYDELRRLAAARMAHEAAGHTLQPTALVHEAWLRLVGDGARPSWQSRAHFFGAAATAMRRILVDSARRKRRLKRGGGGVHLNIEDVDVAEPSADEDVLLIHEALTKLEQANPQQAKIVELKFFGGLTNEEVAENLGIGERTVYREWVCAKARLFRAIRHRE